MANRFWTIFGSANLIALLYYLLFKKSHLNAAGSSKWSMLAKLFQVDHQRSSRMLLQLGTVNLGAFLYYMFSRKPRLNIPGPPKVPIFGNMFQINPERAHIQFAEWSKTYGPVLGLKLLSEDWVVLNSYEVVHEALVKRGADFGGRPYTFITTYATRGNQDIFFSNMDTPHWKPMRKALHKSIKQYSSGMNRIQDSLKVVTTRFMERMGEYDGKPVNPRVDIYNFTLTSLFLFLFGEILDENSPHFHTARGFERDFVETIAFNAEGKKLDLFPWLRFFGNKAFKTLDRAVKSSDAFWEHWKAQLLQNFDQDDINCIIHQMMQATQDVVDEKGNPILKDVNVLMAMVDMAVAGSATTSASLYAMINILLNYPEVKAKVVEEIEAVVGYSRDVTLEDRKGMPYCRAVIYELSRYASVVPLNVPHATLKDTEVGGHKIPKGVQVFPSIWAVHHDEDFWDEPWEFKPERFLDEEGYVVPADHPNRTHMLAFSAGPRVCVGEVFALARLFVFMTNVLQKFDLVPEDPNNMIPCDARTYDQYIVLWPKDYKVKFILRN